MPEPNIILSGTGDGIVGAEIDFDIEGEMWEVGMEIILSLICIELVFISSDLSNIYKALDNIAKEIRKK